MDTSNVDKITSETVFKASLFEVDKLSITLTSGKHITHHIVKRHPTVTIIPVTDSYEIYMVSEYRYMHKKTILELASGFIDSGETPLQAAKRELEEELGIKASHWELLIEASQNASVIDARFQIFLAKGLDIGTPKPMEDEAIEVVKIPLTNAVAMVKACQIVTSVSIIGILLADKLLQEKKL